MFGQKFVWFTEWRENSRGNHIFDFVAFAKNMVNEL